MKELVFPLFVIISILSFGQDNYCHRDLLITNKSTAKTHLILQNSKVKVYDSNNFCLKGALKILDDSTIMLSSMIVPISTIKKISVRRKATKILEVILAAGGASGVFFGSALLYDANNKTVETEFSKNLNSLQKIFSSLMISVGAVYVIGGVGISHIKRGFRSEKYDFSTRLRTNE